MENLFEVYEFTLKTAEQENMMEHCSDKGTLHSYIPVYNDLFDSLKNKPIKLLEIGVSRGYSLFTWKNYFKNAELIMGIDYQPRITFKKEGVKLLYCDINNMDYVNKNLDNLKFDIIIDDGSHNINDQIFAFNYLKSRLNPNGIYVIEDVQNLENDLPQFNPQPNKVYDLRKVKNRWDDVMLVWNG